MSSTMWIMMTSMMAVSTNSWMMVWMFLELNTMVMCYITNKETSMEKKASQTTMIYYICQCLASMFMVFTAMSENIESSMKQLLMTMAFMMKMGAWPFHMWYLKMISMLEMSKKTMMIIMTWQKIIPMYYIYNMTMGQQKITTIIMVLITLNMALSALMLKKANSMKSIIALSSMHFNSWMICSCSSTSCMVMFLSYYYLSLALVMSVVKQMKTKTQMKEKKFWMSSITIMNMGGIPPLLMFSTKVMIMKMLLKSQTPEFSLVMIMTSCVFMYHYFWSLHTLTDMVSKKSQHTMMLQQPSHSITLMTVSIVVLMTMMM